MQTVVHCTVRTHTTRGADFRTIPTAVTLRANVHALGFTDQTIAAIRAMTAVVHGAILTHAASHAEISVTGCAHTFADHTTLIFLTTFAAARAMQIIVNGTVNTHAAGRTDFRAITTTITLGT